MENHANKKTGKGPLAEELGPHDTEAPITLKSKSSVRLHLSNHLAGNRQKLSIGSLTEDHDQIFVSDCQLKHSRPSKKLSHTETFAIVTMDQLYSLLPSAEDGVLPYYLLVVSVAAIGNAVQNLLTLHYTRRIYNGLFTPNPSAGPDSVQKLVPANTNTSISTKDKPVALSDQVTPLAARLFGVYTILAGVIRVYGAYRVNDPVLYQLCWFTHVLAAAHFTSEIVVFKTLRLGWEHAFPLAAGFGGSIWMGLQYGNYVKA